MKLAGIPAHSGKRPMLKIMDPYIGKYAALTAMVLE